MTSVDVMHALTTPCRDILYAVRTILEKTDPELVADISKNGITLTGGGSLLYGFDQLIYVPRALHAMWRMMRFFVLHWVAARR